MTEYGLVFVMKNLSIPAIGTSLILCLYLVGGALVINSNIFL